MNQSRQSLLGGLLIWLAFSFMPCSIHVRTQEAAAIDYMEDSHILEVLEAVVVAGKVLAVRSS
jgi:hypothetical protein